MDNENKIEVEEIMPITHDLGTNLESKKQKKKKIIFIIAFIVAILVVSVGCYIADNNEFINYEIDAIINDVKTEDNENFNNHINSFAQNTYATNNRKAKEFFKLGKIALEENKYSYTLTLFENSANLNDKYKQKIFDVLFEKISCAEDKDNFYAIAQVIVDLGGNIDEASSTKAREYLLDSIEVGKYSDGFTILSQYTSLGCVIDDEINEKIYSTANDCFNTKKYGESIKWFELYRGNKDVSKKYKEAIYEHVIYILFSDTLGAYSEEFEDERAEALHYLSKDEMKNYKQSEGLRLYCRIRNAATELFRNQNSHYAADSYIKNMLVFPNSYKFLGKTVTSDYFMKKGDKEDYCIIAYKFAVAYSTMNLYGNTVSNTIELQAQEGVHLDGSDYVLALKIFNNALNNEDMEKYARTGEFTNNKVTLTY